VYGAHLATYTSAQEQNEVEAFFASNGYLLPTFHQAYWLGLQIREGSAAFSFLDASIKTSYLNWGLYLTGAPGESFQEPNSLFGEEKCAAANYSQLAGVPPAWGYADWVCEEKYVSICRAAAPGAFTYNSPLTNYTYTFNTKNMTFAEGEQYCEGLGGHLVTYRWAPPLSGIQHVQRCTLQFTARCSLVCDAGMHK
jgi:hypothetical protein